MPTRPTNPPPPQPPPEHRPIAEHQQQPDMLQARAATRVAYDRAEHIRAVQTAGAVCLALLAPVLLVFSPGASGALAVAAVLWLLLARTALDTWQRNAHLQGVQRNELYDTTLFTLPWNASLSGPLRLAREQVRSRTHTTVHKDHDWYEQVPNVPWPNDVLSCQTQNLIHSRRNHRSYVRLLGAVLTVTVLAALTLATVRNLTLQQCLVQLAVPLTPALLNLSDLARRHTEAARAQEQLEESVDELLEQRANGRHITAADCREIQDGIFNRRAHQPPVPSRVHDRLRSQNSAAAIARMHDLQEEFNRPPSP
ncbi:S-4TM family putative pore-forming effector [Streptomyces tardus]|nr:S-4TM family putative pore-forming effector [Streptomyces tardus]